jgi:hypothetical protein
MVDIVELCDELCEFVDELWMFVITMHMCEKICVPVDDELFVQ